MTKEQEALKLALEALEEAADAIDSWGSYASGYFQVKHDLEGDISKAKSAITAIKEALMSGTDGAQPEQEQLMSDQINYGMSVTQGGKRIDPMSIYKEPEQEPVTWRYKIVDVFGRPAWTLKTPKSDTRVFESQPLYTTPPQRKPLTDEEERKAFVDWCFSVGLMAQSHGLRSESSDCDTAWKAWKARAAHGIKGEA